jgi:hypothetical protein
VVNGSPYGRVAVLSLRLDRASVDTSSAAFGVLQAVAFAFDFEDVAAVREAV